MAKVKKLNVFYDFIEEMNRSLRNKVFFTNWVLADGFVLDFCNLLLRLGYIYGYKKKYKDNLIYIKIFFVLRKGIPLLLLFNNKLIFATASKRYTRIDLYKYFLLYDLIFLTPYGFCSLSTLKNKRKFVFSFDFIFVGYFSLR